MKRECMNANTQHQREENRTLGQDSQYTDIKKMIADDERRKVNG